MANEGSAKGQKIVFLHSWAEDYRLLPANGVWVGTTPRDEVRIDFFLETHVVPDQVIHPLTGAGLGEEEERILAQDAQEIRDKGNIPVRRIFQVGVTMPIKQALSAANFIKEKIETRAKEEK